MDSNKLIKLIEIKLWDLEKECALAEEAYLILRNELDDYRRALRVFKGWSDSKENTIPKRSLTMHFRMEKLVEALNDMGGTAKNGDDGKGCFSLVQPLKEKKEETGKHNLKYDLALRIKTIVESLERVDGVVHYKDIHKNFMKLGVEPDLTQSALYDFLRRYIKRHKDGSFVNVGGGNFRLRN